MNFETYKKQFNKIQPSTVEGLNNKAYFYYYKKLYKMIASIFIFENTPEEWSIPYLKQNLIEDGKVAVVNTGVGVVPLQTGYFGINIYNQPTDFIISNVILGEMSGKIGVNGEMIYLEMVDGGYYSLRPILERYSELLALVDGSICTSLMNSRIAHVFKATNKAQLKTMEKMYDDISKGKPAVFLQNVREDTEHALFNNVKNSYIGNELMLTKRSIMNDFLTEIGINNSNTDKRERLISDEVNSNLPELNANIYVWDENLKICIEKVNKMFDLNIQYSLNYGVLNSWKKTGGVESV